jgi:uncharacterized protein YjiS (DUF1127 family)
MLHRTIREERPSPRARHQPTFSKEREQMNSSNTYLFDATRQTARPAGAWLSGVFHRLRASWAQRRAVERQMQELYRSSDRELWDMGLSRSDLPEIARGTYRQK